MNPLIQSLSRVSDLWLDPQHPLRRQTVQALQVSTGFSARQVELALNNCFAELTAAKITAYITSLGQSQRRNLDVFHILPANAFTAWVHGAVITLLLGHRCLLKPSTREPVFASAWKKSLEEVNPDLSQRVELVTWNRNLLGGAEAVVAYGSDETLSLLRERLPGTARFAGYGHKLSVGVVFVEAFQNSIDELVETIRRDADPFRLQGCLSPQILYVENPTVSLERELRPLLDVIPKVRTFSQWAEVSKELDRFKPYLSCVGFLGAESRRQVLERELSGHPGLRICPLGQMQRPPLEWRNGGINLADLLN